MDTTAQVTTNAADAGTQNVQTNSGTDANAGDNKPANTAMTQDLNAGQSAGDNKNQPTDAKNTDGSDSGDGQKDQDADKGKTDGAPESYADFSLPENMEVNAVVMEEFKGMAKEAKLPQETAQKFVETGAKLVQEAVESVFTAQVEAYAKKVDTWHETRAKDAEIGGTEEKQNQVVSQAAKAARAIGGDALMKALNETGAGDHPEFIRAFYRIRDLVGEDGKLIQGNLGGSSQKSAAQVLYPNLPTAT